MNKRLVSALGQKRTHAVQQCVSALGKKWTFGTHSISASAGCCARSTVKLGVKPIFAPSAALWRSSVALSAPIASSPALPDKTRSLDLFRRLQSLGGALLGHPGRHHDSVVGIGAVRLVQLEIILPVRHL